MSAQPIYDLTEVATRASRLGRKPKKADVFTMVRELASMPADLDTLANLYAYFLPPTPAKAKGPADWVARAMPTNDVRHYLNYLHSDGSRLMATDGYRLHVVPSELPAGFYDKTLTPITVDGKYPDIDRVIPPAEGGEVYDLAELLPTLELVEVDDKRGIFAYRLHGGVHLQKTYLDQAVRGESGTVRVFDSATSVRIELSGGRLAIIMPMRV